MTKRKTKTETTKMMYLRVPFEMKEKLESIKKRTGLSLNTIILNCISQQLDNIKE